MREELHGIYDLLKTNSETQHFTSLIADFTDVRSRLNNPNLDTTIFAPSDAALSPSLPHLYRLSSEERKSFLLQLLSPYFLTTSSLAHFINFPTLHNSERLNGAQLLRLRPTWLENHGPTYSINFNAHIVVANIRATNGVLHIIDAVPHACRSIEETLKAVFPSKSFSVVQHLISHCGFPSGIGDKGGTFFAPTDVAFRETLGEAGLNALTISEDHDQHMSLLRKHYCPGQTLYSNILYVGEDNASKMVNDPPEREYPYIRGKRTFTLATATSGVSLAIEVDRNGGLVDMRPAEGVRVISSDHLCTGGVIHVVDGLLGKP